MELLNAAYLCEQQGQTNFFFVRLLLFEIWSILMYLCDLMYAKDIRDFCQTDSDANQ